MLYAPVANFPSTPRLSTANATSFNASEADPQRPTPTPSGVLVANVGNQHSNSSRRHVDSQQVSDAWSRQPLTIEDTFTLPTPLVVCLVRHVNRDLDEVATPAPIEQCVRELQQYFTPSIAASQVHGAEPHPSYLPTGRIKVQFGKAMDVYSSDGAAVVNLLLYSVDEEHSRPKLLAHIAKSWREELVKTGNLESCLVMLYRKELAETLTKTNTNTTSVNAAASGMALPSRGGDRAGLEPYFSELRNLHFTPQQMCAYITSEAPLRVLAKLKIGFNIRGQRLRQTMTNYLANKRNLPLDPTQRATTALPQTLTSTLVSRVASSVLTNVPGPSGVDGGGQAGSAHTSPFASPTNLQRQNVTDSSHNNAAVEREEAEEDMNASVAVASTSAQETVTPPASVTQGPHSASQQGTTTTTSWSVRRLWRYGYNLCVHYLQFAYVDAARQTFQQLFMEYYNNSDDYVLVRRAEVLERLAQERCGTLYAIDARTSLQPLLPLHGAARPRVGPYPAALQQGAQLLEGLLLLVACEVGCAMLLRDVHAARTRHDTFAEVVREKLEQSSTALERGLPAGLRLRFLLQCHLTGLRLFWPHYGRLFAPSEHLDSQSVGTHRQADKSKVQGTQAAHETNTLQVANEATSTVSKSDVAGRSVADTITHHEQHLASHKRKETINSALAYLVRLGKAAGLLLGQDNSNAVTLLQPAQVHNGESRLRSVTIHGDSHRGMWHDAELQGQCADLAELVGRVREALGQLGQVMGYAELNNEQLSLVLDTSYSLLQQSPQLRAHSAIMHNTSGTDTQGSCDYLLSSRAGMLQLQRGLTAIAATAYSLAGQHRQAFYLYTSLAGSYVADNALLATRMIAHRLLPYLRRHRWWHIEHFVRRLFVTAVNRRLQQLFDAQKQQHKVNSLQQEVSSVPTNAAVSEQTSKSGAVVDTAEVAQVWFAVFAPAKMYDLFEECLLFLLAATAPAEQLQADRNTAQPTDGEVTPSSKNAVADVQSSDLRRRRALGPTRREWWDWMRYVDAHIHEIVFHGQLPLHDLTPLLHQPLLYVSKVASDKACTVKTDVQSSSNSSEVTPLRVQLGTTVYFSFSATCPVNLLDTTHTSSRIAHDIIGVDAPHDAEQSLHESDASEEPIVRFTLESRKDWDDVGEPVHVVQLTARAQDTSYDATTQQMCVRVAFQPFHAGLYRLRCLAIHAGVSTFAFCPPHEMPESMSELHEDVHTPLAQGVGSVLEKPERDRGVTAVSSVAAPNEAQQKTTSLGLQCGRLLLVVPEPRTGVQLRVELPTEEHYFADAPSYFTLHVELDEALLRPTTPTPTTTTSNTVKTENVMGEVAGHAVCSFEPDTGLLSLSPPPTTTTASGHWYSSANLPPSGNSPRSMLLSASGAATLDGGSFAFQPDPAVVAVIHMVPHRSAHSVAAVPHGTGLLSPDMTVNNNNSIHVPPSPQPLPLAATMTSGMRQQQQPGTSHSATRRSSMPSNTVKVADFMNSETMAGSRSGRRHPSPPVTMRHAEASAVTATTITNNALLNLSFTAGLLPPLTTATSRELTRGVLIESNGPHWGIEPTSTTPAPNTSGTASGKVQPAVAAHFAAAMAARSRLRSPHANTTAAAHSVSSVESRSVSPSSTVLEESHVTTTTNTLQPAATYSSFASSGRHAGSPARSVTTQRGGHTGSATQSPNRAERRGRITSALLPSQQQQERFMALSSLMPLPSSSAAVQAHHMNSPQTTPPQRGGTGLRVVVLQLPTSANAPGSPLIHAAPPDRSDELNKAATVHNNANNNNNNNTLAGGSATPAPSPVRPTHTTLARTVLPLDESEALAHLPRPQLTHDGAATLSSSLIHDTDRFSLDGLITTSTHGRLGCHIRILRDKTVQSPLQLEDAEENKKVTDGTLAESSADKPNSAAVRSDTNSLEGSRAHSSTQVTLRLPLLPFFVTPAQETTKIGFACVRGHETCTTSTFVSFAFTTAIETQYNFRHFQGRVYCVVTIRNTLQRTPLWLRGAMLRVLDASPTYDVLRICSAYEHLLHTPWQPQMVLQLMFELALSPHYESAEAVRDHTVQLQIFYSDWARTYMRTPVEDRVVLLPMRMAATEAGSAGPRSQSSTLSSSSSSSSTTSESEEGRVDKAVAADTVRATSEERQTAHVTERMSNVLSPLTPLQQEQEKQQEVKSLVPLLSAGNMNIAPVANLQPTLHAVTQNSAAQSSPSNLSEAETTAALHYNPAVLERLTRQCNCYLAPEASFRSTHLYLFSAVIYAESPWTTRRGATPTTTMMKGVGGSALAVNSPHFSQRRHTTNEGSNNSNSSSNGSLVTPGMPLLGNAMVDAPSSFDFVAGEPVRFCVRLEPHPANWPEDAAAKEDFFIDLVFDPAQWMVIGKQRERRTLSVMDDVTIHFTAVPLLPTTTNTSVVSHDVTALPSRTAGRYTTSTTAVTSVPADPSPCSTVSTLQLAGHTVCDEGILATPTVKMYWARRVGSTAQAGQPAAATQLGAEVRMEVVPFRVSVRVRKPLR